MRRRLFNLLSRSHRAQKRELEEEIEAHLSMRVDDLQQSGLDKQAAQDEALRRFGDLGAAKKTLLAASASRDRRLSWAERIDGVRRDLLITFRRMRAHKARTALLVAIFALGIGITTVTFSVVDNVLLRALPYPDPSELVELQSVGERGGAFPYVSMGNWFDWRSENTTLASTGLHRTYRGAIATENQVVRVDVTQTIGEFFDATASRVGAWPGAYGSRRRTWGQGGGSESRSLAEVLCRSGLGAWRVSEDRWHRLRSSRGRTRRPRFSEGHSGLAARKSRGSYRSCPQQHQLPEPGAVARRH